MSAPTIATTPTTQPPNPLRSRTNRTGRAGWPTYVVLGLTAVIFLVPFYYTFISASRSMSDMAQHTFPLTPGDNLWSNIRAANEQQNMPLAILNSLIVASAITAATLLFCTLAGFAFAKLRFSGRNLLFGIAIGTLMIPPTLGVVPLYKIMADLNLTGKLPAVILPTLVGAFGVFFMRQFLIQALPDELLEAATVDGATTTRTFLSIVLPIARPGMAVLGMLTFMAAWNDFFWPVVALSGSSTQTVQVALKNLGGGYVPDQSIILAGTLVGTLPVIVVFVLLGRQIVSGIMQGAVKG